jgi:twitching motility protein PilT
MFSLPTKQQQIRVQLSMVLQCVIFAAARALGGRRIIPAFEIMNVNNAVRNMIVNRKHID